MKQLSKERLATCDERLQRLVTSLLGAYPTLVVICGHRGKAEQDAAVAAGNSKTPWPTSKHNSLPSLAVDLAPSSPIKWGDIEAFKKLGEDVKKQAAALGIHIRWGGDFKTFKDYPHFEIIS